MDKLIIDATNGFDAASNALELFDVHYMKFFGQLSGSWSSNAVGTHMEYTFLGKKDEVNITLSVQELGRALWDTVLKQANDLSSLNEKETEMLHQIQKEGFDVMEVLKD